MKLKAIQMANDHIQIGNLSILYFAKDNPLLDDSLNFDKKNSKPVFLNLNNFLSTKNMYEIVIICNYVNIFLRFLL